MHCLEPVVVRPQEPSSFGHAVQFCLELVIAMPQVADFKVLGSQRSPEPPYFANQRGTILNTERSLPVDVPLKFLESFDLHGALSLFKSGILHPSQLPAYHYPRRLAKRQQRQPIGEFYEHSGVSGCLSCWTLFSSLRWPGTLKQSRPPITVQSAPCAHVADASPRGSARGSLARLRFA